MTDIPVDLQDKDVSVKGVISFYGVTDLRAFFQDGFGRVNETTKALRMQKNLLGCYLGENFEAYKLA
jgi:hypothetical protein